MAVAIDFFCQVLHHSKWCQIVKRTIPLIPFETITKKLNLGNIENRVTVIQQVVPLLLIYRMITCY